MIKIVFGEIDGLAYAVLVTFWLPVRPKSFLSLRLALRKRPRSPRLVPDVVLLLLFKDRLGIQYAPPYP
jgi:hypothetical protein